MDAAKRHDKPADLPLTDIDMPGIDEFHYRGARAVA
jgi:hypothetical protein